jgi:hypothetical protein
MADRLTEHFVRIGDRCAANAANGTNGANGAYPIRDKNIWPTLHGWLTAERQAAIDAFFPDRLHLPYIHLPYKNRTATIEYTAAGKAILAARLQDL